MSVSTDAVLFYGYCWEDDDGILEKLETEWQEQVAVRRGHVSPWDSYPATDHLPYDQQRKIGNKWCDDNRAAIDEWVAVKNRIEKEFGCEVGRHCSDQYAVPYVFVEGSVTTANRGCPQRIDSWPSVGADWNEKLERFCNELEIKPPEGQKPGWWLVSFWG